MMKTNEIISKVLYLKVGKPSITKLKNQKRKELFSSIKKKPIEKSFLTKTGFKDDVVADTLHHGGENKALFFFSLHTYEKINKALKSSLSYNKTAVLGENILVNNIDEESVCVGDIWQIGETIVQITQPRQPCWKLSANTSIKEMTKFVFETGLTGWYAKVLKEGNISKNDNIILQEKGYENLSIKKLNILIVNPMLDVEVTKEALECDDLGLAFKQSLQKRYTLKEADEQFSYYHT